MIAHFLFVELGIDDGPRWTPWFDEDNELEADENWDCDDPDAVFED